MPGEKCFMCFRLVSEGENEWLSKTKVAALTPIPVAGSWKAGHTTSRRHLWWTFLQGERAGNTVRKFTDGLPRSTGEWRARARTCNRCAGMPIAPR